MNAKKSKTSVFKEETEKYNKMKEIKNFIIKITFSVLTRRNTIIYMYNSNYKQIKVIIHLIIIYCYTYINDKKNDIFSTI